MRTAKPFTAENLPGSSVCLLSHYAAVDSAFTSTLKIIHNWSVLHSVLGPQHGFWGETQDNMIEWEGYIHERYGVPVNSLYGKTRIPTDKMLAGADCVLIDLADIGSRYYTYIYSMAFTMRRCAELGIPVAVIDRSNPLGTSLVEGPILDMEFRSFVGLYPIPVRHGLTIGELALLFAQIDGLPEPVILFMKGNQPWVMPSPNMPTADTALVYPGMCLLEATNLSEGRGTTRPFEIFGAPWLNPWELCDELNNSPFVDGAVLRPHFFIPTFNKHAGVKCAGAQIHVTDTDRYRPFKAVLGILNYCFRKGETTWNNPPYEYEYKKMPVDILAGGSHVRFAVDAGDAGTLIKLSETPSEVWKKTVNGVVDRPDRFLFR
ncbi:DUF1343 domain-containing protein [Candidatus Fermentibacteria bacterium]|nr:MAG: DUF1343 domain-containing protein [Candidatus Fermentibacteria bacterium]